MKCNAYVLKHPKPRNYLQYPAKTTSQRSMSIDLNWETLTSGPDGDALAESIRSFIHDKFQAVPLPRFIKSVTVHGFDFGKIPPELELKDITDPLPDFYEQELEDGGSDDDFEDEDDYHAAIKKKQTRSAAEQLLRHDLAAAGHDMGPPFLGTSTPGIHGGPGLSYFHNHMGGHMGTGSQTPLAAVAGGNNWMSGQDDRPAPPPSGHHSRHASLSSIISVEDGNLPSSLPSMNSLKEKSSVSTLAPTSVGGTSRPPTRDTMSGESAIMDDDEEGGEHALHAEEEPPRRREPRVDDVQAVFRILYSGDIRLNLTAEILLDYPMPSFVGIPLKLNITGLSFDGVGVLAHIRKRVHFCFLSPEDALTAVGPDPEPADGQAKKGKFGGLLQEIKVDSEIGERESGKQSLKNVGKVEKFVLEQVRRIFEEEFVYPSFWTFLV